jgi:chromosome segregation ATPase
MDVDQISLDDYEKAMEDLLEEMRQLQSATDNLNNVNERLARIQSAYATAGKALLSVAERASATLKSIDSLELANVPATLNRHYEQHQKSLDSLDQAVGDAVREQQRLGLEMLQHTSASQKQFDEFASQYQKSAAELRDQIDSLLKGSEALSSRIDVNNGQLEKRMATVQNLIVVVILFVLVVGAIAYFQ